MMSENVEGRNFMKKLLAIVLAAVCVLSFSACDNDNGNLESSTTTATEENKDLSYNIDDYLEVSEKVLSEYDEKIKYLTDEEIKETGQKYMEEAMRNYDIPSGSKITIRGKVYSGFGDTGFYMLPSDCEELDFDDPKYIYADCSDYSFLGLNSKIVEVEGVLESATIIKEAKITSPTKIEYDWTMNNIFNICNDIGIDSRTNCVAIGTVYVSDTIEEASELLTGYKDFFEEQKDATHVLFLSSEDDVGSADVGEIMICFLDMSESSVEFQTGDHIAVLTNIFTKASGETYLTTSSDFYKFED